MLELRADELERRNAYYTVWKNSSKLVTLEFKHKPGGGKRYLQDRKRKEEAE